MNHLIHQILHDRYKIESLIGRKTGRRTFLATDLETRSLVVIKLLLFGPDFTWDDLKLFEREAQTLQSLDHPAIPQYLDSFEMETELGKGFALVQSYIEARSLREWVQCGCTFGEAELKEIATQLLEVLEYLHTRQPPVIHRDIKPGNVLLRNRSGNSAGQIYLIDFGSVQTAQQGGTITVVGTYGYMPPEQFGGRSLPASDLYSVGATLIYLATGQDPADLPQKDLQIQFESCATLGHPFVHWIQWLTHPDLSKRPASATEALQPLHQGFQERLIYSPAQPFAVGIGDPGSKIQLQKTPEVLKITVPANKFGSGEIDSRKNQHGCLSGLGCSSSVLGLFLGVAYLGWIGFFLWVLGVAIAGSLCSRSSKPYTPSYNLTLQHKGHSITVDVIANQSKEDMKIPQMQLKTIHAGHNDVPKYRLSLNCCSDFFYITGNRAEIQWLCDELNEWTGLEIQYENYTTYAV
ncbi:serine/threonine protein kinase [Leptothermofonsia sp. ETS-13]|uniref:serine/threonine protein kinase n=1 Tax=Leptothermofonsia sp. ETS-13 TaxID=3035696 RepID=UPI003B9E5E7C